MSYNSAYAALSQDVYRQNITNGDTVGDWSVVKSFSASNGYQSALYENKITGEFAYVSRGTEPSSLVDVSADLQMGVGLIPAQFEKRGPTPIFHFKQQ